MAGSIRMVLMMVAISFSACASDHMARYMGADMDALIADHGAPVATKVISDKRKAVEFFWSGNFYDERSGSSYVSQASRQNEADPQRVLKNGYIVSNGFLTPAFQAVQARNTDPGCNITFYTEWSEDEDKWIVVDYLRKNNIFC